MVPDSLVRWHIERVLQVPPIIVGYEVPLYMTKIPERRITVRAEFVNGVAVITCPSRYHIGHGVPGTAACKALLVMYARSGSDFRFHPTNCIWSHEFYHLANYKLFSEFVPMNFSTLPASLVSSGEQLWPPNTWKGSGRPRSYSAVSSCYNYCYRDYYCLTYCLAYSLTLLLSYLLLLLLLLRLLLLLLLLLL